VPPDTRSPELERDFQMVQEKVLGEPSEFERLLEMEREIEQTIIAKKGG
jgi:hypothetical protein